MIFNNWQLSIWHALINANGKRINFFDHLGENSSKIKHYELEDFFNFLVDKKFVQGHRLEDASITPDGRSYNTEVIGQLLSGYGSTEEKQSDNTESKSEKTGVNIDNSIRTEPLLDMTPLSTIKVSDELKKMELKESEFHYEVYDHELIIRIRKDESVYFYAELMETGFFAKYTTSGKSSEENFSTPLFNEIYALFRNWLSLIKPGILDKITNIKNENPENFPIKFYAVGAYWGDDNDQSDRFFKEGIWENGYETDYVKIVNEIKRDDVLILKATYSGFFRVKGIGVVEKNAEDGHKLMVKWIDIYENQNGEPDWVDIDGSLDQYQRTIAKINSIEHIHQVFSYFPEAGSEVQKIIDQKLTQDLEIVTESIVEIESEPSQDMLGAKDIASIFLQMILSANSQVESPDSKTKKEEQFYGIFGQWGRGKTFFWKKVKEIIKEQYSDKLLPIEFHAWKYQDTPATWAYLFEVLAKEYYNKPKSVIPRPDKLFGYWFRGIWFNIYRGILKGFSFFTLSLLASFFLFSRVSSLNDLPFIFAGSLTGITAIWSFLRTLNKAHISTAKEYLKKITEHVTYTEHLGLQHEIQKEIKHLLKAWLGKGDKKILLFVDDIDRCRENKIIELVDSLRVMMDDIEISNHIIVVAAIDEEILKMAIESKYKNYENKPEQISRIKKEYMDKLFLAGLKLPVLGGQEKINVLKGFLEHKLKKIKPPQEMVGEDSGKTDKSKVVVKDSNFSFTFDQRVSTIKKIEESYQLTDSEYQELNDLVLKLNDATPRVIRSFTIKYRLGKNIISILIGNDNDLIAEWHQDKMKQHFAQLLLEALNKQEFNPNSELSDKLIIILKTALEMVVPY
ncbi:P-loop NTPase fold protein [Fulvivirga sp.]|uniref:P-loop NTPase fold protein n=1 Tax=Fulvivirga sp. TaxID=1931237 RepID=UPI0032F03273